LGMAIAVYGFITFPFNLIDFFIDIVM